MNYILNIVLGITLIFACTTLGSSLVFFFRKTQFNEKVNQVMIGFASGVMLSASIFSLIVPALNTEVTYMPSYVVVALALILGGAFLFLIDKLIPHYHVQEDEEEGIKTTKVNKITKMFLAVTIHNIPEGLSVGIAYGVALLALHRNDENAMMLFNGALMLAIGIGIQNIPEGAVVSLPIKAQTGKTGKAFAFGTFSGLVEPIAALIGLGLAMMIEALMPWALAFAAGCMLYVIVEDMIPDLHSSPVTHYGLISFFIGFIVMMVLDNALG